LISLREKLLKIRCFFDDWKELNKAKAMSDHFKKLGRMYLSANINQRIFPSTAVQINKGSAEISIEVNDDYFHAMNALHGAVYFKLMDDAAYFAANSLVADYMLLTAQFDIRFLRPVFEGKIKAVGTYIGR
jgi:acyl-coenzyme A thioesterase PaaI-like protein